jgi:hypothetical protein
LKNHNVVNIDGTACRIAESAYGARKIPQIKSNTLGKEGVKKNG